MEACRPEEHGHRLQHPVEEEPVLVPELQGVSREHGKDGVRHAGQENLVQIHRMAASRIDFLGESIQFRLGKIFKFNPRVHT